LIVDDDPAIRLLLRTALEGDGHCVRDVPDGMQALERLRASAVPLIVLLDWHMPQLDGRGVLRAVTAEPQLAAMHRFVLVTADDGQRDGESAALLRELQVPVIPKPFDLQAVLDVIAEIAAS
jgi:two-component system chemotaxis response regulator CheY